MEGAFVSDRRRIDQMESSEQLSDVEQQSQSPSFEVEVMEVMDAGSNSGRESSDHVERSPSIITNNSLRFSPQSQSSPREKNKSARRKQYLSSWESHPAAFYLSYSYDSLGKRQSQSICWLYKKTGGGSGTITMGCRLCEQYRVVKNKNGKENVWATTGFNILALDKVKEHHLNERHREAERLEIQRTSMTQPDWISARSTVLTRHEESVMNLIFSCVYLCQNDHSLNSLSPLCNLLEKIGVKLLPAEVSGVSYRNDTAALVFLQHVASVLHDDLLLKIRRSPVLGEYSHWILSSLLMSSCPQSTCRLDDGWINISFCREELHRLRPLLGWIRASHRVLQNSQSGGWWIS